jgi:amino acid adenylation domain-containing protein
MVSEALHLSLERQAESRTEHPAVEEADGRALSYRELVALSHRLRDRLAALGVGRGDRVGFVLPKSIDAVASLFGILQRGAAYVPVDPAAPADRNAYILHDCSVAAVIVDPTRAAALQDELSKHGELPPLLVLDSEVGHGRALGSTLETLEREAPAPQVPTVACEPDELAYILYTSGSTGRPKGVMVSHRAAMAFVDWCCETFGPRPEDRLSSHAPFHFDLSIHDLHVSMKTGASVVLIGEELGKDPARLAAMIAERRISIWYSAPSILSLLAQYGRLERHDLSRLRIVHFAGEVFPVKHLRATQALLPRPRYYNLYGPTETNVCTWHPIPTVVPESRSEPYPIGLPCAHYETRVIDGDGNDVAPGEEGELLVAGSGVMSGYWNLPEQNARAFLEHDGRRWYRTGDVVVEGDDGAYLFRGRRDRMVKRRAYRVELGEIEAGLYRHPGISEAAVVAIPDEEAGVQIVAFLATRGGEKLSMIKLKRFCAGALPAYMAPDRFCFVEALPKTSTDKVDYQKLMGMT